MNKVFNDVQNIRLNVTIEADSAVNNDDPKLQSIILSQLRYPVDSYENKTLAKKLFYTDGFRYFISSDCIRHALFTEIRNEQSNKGNIAWFYQSIPTILMLVRGYVYPSLVKPIKKKSVLSTVNAEEIVDKPPPHNIPLLSCHSSNVYRPGKDDFDETLDDVSTKTSLHYSEAIGKRLYATTMVFDMTEAQIIVADVKTDRDNVGVGLTDYELEQVDEIYNLKL